MYQKDYILRMLEMLSELIAAMLGLIKRGDLTQASQILDRAYRDFLKEDAVLFRGIPKEKLTDHLLGVHNYTNGHLRILSELFYIEAELEYAGAKRESSLEYYEKSLTLLEFVEKESNTFSFESQDRKRVIEERITQIKGIDSY